jgi:hypothetical protein
MQIGLLLLPTYAQDVSRQERLAWLLAAGSVGLLSIRYGHQQDERDGSRRAAKVASREVELHQIATETAWKQQQIQQAYFPESEDGEWVDGGELSNPTDLTQFDLALLQECDRTPMVAIVGPTGSGKSMLTTWIAQTQIQSPCTIKVYDTDCTPGEWKGLSVHGRGGRFESIAEQFQVDLEELSDRTAKRGAGREFGESIALIVEEFPTLAADLDDLHKGLAFSWFSRIARRGRKYRMRLFLVSQNWNVKALRIEGDGELRDAFTVFHLGASAVRAIKRERNEKRRATLQQFLSSNQRACVIEHDGQFWPWIVPDLSVPTLSNAVKTPVTPILDAEPIDVRALLDRQFQMSAANYPAVEEIKPSSPVLSQECALVVAAASQNGGEISVREAMRSKGLNKFTAAQMLAFFQQIERQGVGTVVTLDQTPPRYILRLN